MMPFQCEFKAPGILEIWPHPLDFEGKALAERVADLTSHDMDLENAENEKAELEEKLSDMDQTLEELKDELLEIRQLLEEAKIAPLRKELREDIEAIRLAVEKSLDGHWKKES